MARNGFAIKFYRHCPHKWPRWLLGKVSGLRRPLTSKKVLLKRENAVMDGAWTSAPWARTKTCPSLLLERASSLFLWFSSTLLLHQQVFHREPSANIWSHFTDALTKPGTWVSIFLWSWRLHWTVLPVNLHLNHMKSTARSSRSAFRFTHPCFLQSFSCSSLTSNFSWRNFICLQHGALIKSVSELFTAGILTFVRNRNLLALLVDSKTYRLPEPRLAERERERERYCIVLL